MTTYISAAEFKAKCLKLMDDVQVDRVEVVITKHGKPVAKLVPIAAPQAQVFGRMRGSVKITGDIMGEPGHLSKRAHDAIEAAAAHGALRVSVMSVAELAWWEAAGRVALSKDRLAWVREALATPGLALVPLTPEIAVEGSRLPGDFKGDATDALLVATARLADMTLMTGGTPLLAYARGHHVRVFGVCR